MVISGKARKYAGLSALFSLIYMLCIPAVLIMLFVNWKIAILIVVGGYFSAMFGKVTDKKKYQEIYGKELGSEIYEAEWANKKKGSNEHAARLAELHRQHEQKIRNN